MGHYDDDEPEQDDRDHREVTLYDDEALEMMTHWWGGQGDPLYAIHSMGGQHEAWVFQHAISNLDSDLSQIKKVGRDKYQLGKGVFKKADIDELRHIRDALEMAVADVGMNETAHHVADFNTIDELLQHEKQRGATHWSVDKDSTSRDFLIYYPLRGQNRGKYQEAKIVFARGFYHAPSSSHRGRVVSKLPVGAEPIGSPEEMREARREIQLDDLKIGDAVQFRFEPETGGVIEQIDSNGEATVKTPKGMRQIHVENLRHVHPKHIDRTRRSVSEPGHELLSEMRKESRIHPGAYLPVNIGETVRFSAHGSNFLVKYHSRNTFVLNTDPPGQRRRWGSRDQITDDIAYVLENGALPLPRGGMGDETGSERSRLRMAESERDIAGEYHTRSGKIGTRIYREHGRHGVTYSYSGEWGAGSGHSADDMQREVNRWIRDKRGIKVVIPFTI